MHGNNFRLTITLLMLFKDVRNKGYGSRRTDRAAPENQGLVFQVQHYDTSDQGVSSCSDASEDQQCYRNNGSGHNEMATMRE